MFKIVRFPARLEKFFGPLKDNFLWDHFEYFRTMVLLMAFSWGQHNVSSLFRFLDPRERPHRTRFNNFLLVARWNPEEVLRTKACGLLSMLKPQKGEVVELILDDSKKEKRGKKMEAVSWMHDHAQGKKIRGHQYVQLLIRFRGFLIPFGIRLYVKKELCRDLQIDFKKTTELAAQLISAFDAPSGVRVRVLFDSYYLCPTVVKTCRQKNFRFVSTLKSNRNLFKDGRKLKAAKYGKNLFKRKQKKTCSLRKGNKVKRYRYCDCGWLKVGRTGELHVVYSRKEGEKKIVALATDDRKLSAKGIIDSYSDRWHIEVYFKSTKQLLGLGQYQNASYWAAVTHLHLVCFAYALLTHIAIEREGAKRKKKRKTAGKSTSTADLQNELRRIVWDDLSDYLKALPTGNQVIKELERLLIAA